MKSFMLTGCLLLSGCLATVPEVVEVKIPIAMPCKAEEPVQPIYNYAPPYTTAFDGARDLLVDRELALGYEEELRAALRSCK